MAIPILSPQQVQTIHDGALRLLSRVGVRVKDAEARRLLAEVGAEVDWQSGQVRLSERMVIDALQSSPSKIRLIGRDGSQLDLAPGSPRHYHMTADNKMDVVALDSGEIRRSTREDVALLTRLADALPNIDAVLPMAAANDVPNEFNPLLSAQAIFLNTTKHVLASPVSLQEAVIYTEMARLLCPDGDLQAHPIVSGAAAITSPLVFDPESAAMVVHFARAGCPLFTCSAPLVGAASPVTLASSLVLENAEVLFTLVLAQAARRGTPVVYWVSPVLIDMRTAQVSVGRVEQLLLNFAVGQLADQYQLPCGAPLVKGDRDANPIYTGAMKMASYLGALAGGLSISLGAGYLRTMVSDAVQLVIDDELLALAKRLFRGFTVEDETLALDLIERIGPGGDFMTERHTVEWLRRGEHYFSWLFHDSDVLEGKRTVEELAREKVDHIRASHRPAIPPEAAAVIDEYVQQKAEELKSKRRE